jgi:hypothetical protein
MKCDDDAVGFNGSFGIVPRTIFQEGVKCSRKAFKGCNFGKCYAIPIWLELKFSL